MDIYLGLTTVFFKESVPIINLVCRHSCCFSWLRKCSCQPKHKVFFWPLLKNHFSTRDLLKRRTTYRAAVLFMCPLFSWSWRILGTHACIARFAAGFWSLVHVHNTDPLSEHSEVSANFKRQLQVPLFIILLYCGSLFVFKEDQPTLGKEGIFFTK